MKTRKHTIISFLFILVIYNLAVFLIPSIRNIGFWIAYVFSNLSILVSGLAILWALDENKIKNKIRNMPIVYVAWAYLVLQLILGAIEIYYPVNYRYSILANVILLGIGTVGLVSVNIGKKEIIRVEEKVKEKVFVIKDWQVDIQNFMTKISEKSTKKELEKLEETIKYSDPMSHNSLATIENNINNKIQQLIHIEDNNEKIKQLCGEIQELFGERNRKVKMYKNQPDNNDKAEKTINMKLIIAVIVIILCLTGIGVTTYFTVIVPNGLYNEAMNLYNNKQYLQAKEKFKSLGDYKDSNDKQNEVIYEYATELLKSKEYEKAEYQFNLLENYKDAKDKKDDTIYQKATDLLEQKKYSESAKEFSKILNYKDAKDKQNEAIYNNAIQLLNEKEYSKSAEEFSKILNYKDSSEKLNEINNLFGDKDVINLGIYNGKSISWKILRTEDNKALLICTNSIEDKAFNSEYKSVNWEESSIREWLNTEFYNCFSQNEKERILKNEEDNVFLLSKDEFNKYTKVPRIATSWWLRTSGSEQTKAMYVSENGVINREGELVTKLNGVRPAIWINI